MHENQRRIVQKKNSTQRTEYVTTINDSTLIETQANKIAWVREINGIEMNEKWMLSDMDEQKKKKTCQRKEKP